MLQLHSSFATIARWGNFFPTLALELCKQSRLLPPPRVCTKPTCMILDRVISYPSPPSRITPPTQTLWSTAVTTWWLATFGNTGLCLICFEAYKSFKQQVPSLVCRRFLPTFTLNLSKMVGLCPTSPFCHAEPSRFAHIWMSCNPAASFFIAPPSQTL